MERFMDVSRNFMESIDLQNGVFEEEGMAMLEKWEKEGVSFLLGGEKNKLISSSSPVNLEAPLHTPDKGGRGGNQYDSFFN